MRLVCGTGGNPLRGGYCDNAEQYSESVQFYYSTDLGQNWTLWETYQYHQYRVRNTASC